MIRSRWALIGVATVLVSIFAAGCSTSSKTSNSARDSVATTTTTGSPTLEQAREAGAIARAIENEPTRMDAILAEHGTNAESFEKLIFEIAKDPTLSEAYQGAKGGTASTQ